MNRELILYRTIMRLYTCCEFDHFTHTLKILSMHDILNVYFNIEEKINREFSKHGIEVYLAGVKSNFGNVIKTNFERSFIYNRISFDVPHDIIEVLSKFLASRGRKHTVCNQQKLFLGYVGRVFDTVTNQQFVTEGIQSNDRIIIDFLTFLEQPHDCLHHRIIHELLHSLGIEEDEMVNYIHPACSISYNMSKPFISSILTQAPNIHQIFTKIEQAIFADNENLANELIELGHRLYLQGFPASMDEILYTTVYAPAKLFPDPDFQPFRILLM